MFTWSLIGHQKITHLLESAINNGRLSHAYIFYGPRQIGKKTLVKKFIQILVCTNNDKEKIPCGECEHCRQLQKNIHPDVIWLKKEEDKKNISVEQIRELQEKLSVHSFFKSYKIAVIEEAESMNLEAANALLKTLEEPAKKTIIILLAQKINFLPKTILSRSQLIKFLPVPTKEIYAYLIGQGINPEKSQQLAHLSAGQPGRALTFSANEEIWQNYLLQLKNFFLLIQSSTAAKIKFTEKMLASIDGLVNQNKTLLPLLNLWQMLVRDMLMYKFGATDKIINLNSLDYLPKTERRYSLTGLIYLQNLIQTAQKDLRFNANPRLTLENLLLNL